MIRKTVFINITIAFVGILMLVSLAIPPTPWAAATITVKPDGSGNFKTVQEALDASAAGDTVLVYSGVYNEDINIGHVNLPPVKKDNITLKAADGETVEIDFAGDKNRVASLAAAGADFGPVDRLGFLIYSDGAVIEGIKFVQNNKEVNALGIGVAIIIISSNVTIRNCEIVGPDPAADGDLVGMAVSPLDVVSVSQGTPALATNFLVENCKFSKFPYAFANSNLLLTLGLPVPSAEATVRNCEFTGNSNGVEIDDGTTHVIDCHIHDNIGSGFHLSDDTTTITNCIIEKNGEHGINIDNQELEDAEPQEHPEVTIDGCLISNNGTTDHRGIRLQCGSLKVTNSIIQGSAGPNVYFDTQQDRELKAVFDHCDIYKSKAGIGVASTPDIKYIMDITFTNSIIVDTNGIINDAGIELADFRVDYCDILASGAAVTGDLTSNTNNLTVDPEYVGADQGNFYLKPSSRLITTGKGGVFIGSKGVATAVTDWMVK
jgi:hypothetical protein